MANDVIGFPHNATGATLYAQVRNDDGQIWNTSGTPAFEAYLTANIADYDIALTEQGTASRFYTFTFPSAIVAGVYSIAVYSGATAEGDPAVAEGEVEWDGSAVVAQSGDSFGRLGSPAGADVSADVAAIKAETVLIVSDTGELQTAWVNGGRLDVIVDAILVDTGTTLQAELDAIQVAVITNAAGVDIAADIIALKAETVLIVADTNELQTDWVNAGRLDLILDAIPTTAEFDARTLVAASYFDPAADTVANVTTVATTTTNTDMVGTDSAALAANYTSARAGYLDNLNISENVSGTSEVGHLVLATGTSDSGTTTTVVDTERIEATTDHWNDKMIVFGSGGSAINVGHCGLITGFTPSTDTITFAPPALTPITTETYKIVPWAKGDLLTATQTSIDAIEADTGTDGVVIASSEDVYHADIVLSKDDTNTTDEYSIAWFKNGVRIASGITVPTIQVVKRVDGTDLVASTAMTQIGTTGSYKYDEATNRITAGEAVLVIVAATIDSGSRSFAKVISRDST